MSFNHRLAFLALGSSMTLLAGCSGGESSPDPSDEPTYVHDIQPLVQAKCVGCHTEGGIGPFPLRTYEQVTAMQGPVAAAVEARIMPPWPAADGCADYRGDFSLTDEQIDTLTRWVDAGAPMGDPGDTPVKVEDDRLSLSRVDLELPIPEPYTQKTLPDDYRCFFLDWPEASTKYVTGFGVTPGNASIVHHVIAYVVKPENVAMFQALDDAAEGPGWPCFGGPTGEEATPGAASWLGGWAPGGMGEDFPEGTGIEIPAGAKLVVQVHYNSLTQSPAPDETKVLVRTDTSVKTKAAVMPFADLKWLMGAMPIPAHSKDVVHSYTADPTTLVKLLTGGAAEGGKPLTVYSTGSHMHTRGTRIMTRVDHAGGAEECLTDIPRWNFHWQMSYRFMTPKVISPGDELHLECHWDNPGDMDMNWGEGTDDEMCLGIYYITE